MVKRPDTVQMLEAALRAASLKQATIANNIANVQTPGFRRSDVQFQDLLDKALTDGDGDLEGAKPEIYQPMNTPVDTNGNDTNMDLEVGELVKNDTNYKMYMRLMAKAYHQVDQAIGS